MTYRIIFGPWDAGIAAMLRRNYTGYHIAERIEQILSMEHGCHVMLMPGWETRVDPQYMADFLAAKGATAWYAFDSVQRLPEFSGFDPIKADVYVGPPEAVRGQVLDGELMPAPEPTTVPRSTLISICEKLGFDAARITRIEMTSRRVTIERDIRGPHGHINGRADGTIEKESITLEVVGDADGVATDATRAEAVSKAAQHQAGATGRR